MDLPPEKGTYNFVLRTIRPYNATIRRTVYTYDETRESLDITHPDGVRHPTVFISSREARDRLVCDGWEDVTGPWMDHLAAQEGTPTPPRRPAIKIKA